MKKRKKRKPQIIICLLIVFSLINIYFEISQYGSYRNAYSASFSRQTQFRTTQTTYAWNAGDSQSLFEELITDRDVIVYGYYNELQAVFESFARKVEWGGETAIDFEKIYSETENMLEFSCSSLHGYYAYTGMTKKQSERLLELRTKYRPSLYVYDARAAQADTVVCVVDENSVIYIIDEMQAEDFLYD